MSIALDLALALDPARFMSMVLGEPDEWQANFLRSPAKRVLLNCCRQSGKSTTTAVRALHQSLYHDDQLVLMLSPGLRQSKELFGKALAMYRGLDRPVPAVSETKQELQLANGSRIVSLPDSEGRIRGYSAVDLLIIDEASRVSDGLYASVRPMLAVSGGSLIAMSTPFGRRGWWSDAWHDDAGEWERTLIRAEDCPRISDEFLEEERRNLGAWWYAQEYECRFLDSATAAFTTDDIDSAFKEGLEQWIIT